jgi:sarcosine oxidase, subunit alpha
MTPRTGPCRLAYGGQIDRTRRIAFRFDGVTYSGHPGDTLASALLANGVRIVARSFKYHRPRGIYSSGIEEPNALVRLGEGARAVPSVRAPTIELTEGLEARSQEGWPAVGFDLGRGLDAVAPLWSAGFYNKTFIWPKWHTYEGVIRRLAGLGRAPSERDPDRYEVTNLHCDLLVVGGGRAGLCAALDAARAGSRVVLAEQDRDLGGEIAWDGSGIGDLSGTRWIAATVEELAHFPNVRLLTRTTAVGCYDHNVVALAERTQHFKPGGPRERLHIVRAHRLVLATGAIEQPLVFANNDRPGILLAGAARQYLRRYGVTVGRRVLIATNNDSAYALACDLALAGVTVPTLIDRRPETEVPQALRHALRDKGIEFRAHSIPVDTAGFGELKKVTVGRLAADERTVEASEIFRCDALAVSGGFAPALQLYAQAGGALGYDAASGALHPVTRHPSVEILGTAARPIASGPRISPVGNTRRQWIDLAHDVTVADLELSLRENYSAVEHVKRYTTVGMAADQGKTSHAATLGILGRLRGISPRELGHTTLRPPVTPVTLGTVVGRETGERFAPKRLLPMHDWHVTHGAILHDFGGWQRPVAYLRPGETREHAAWREQHAVRTAAGLFDSSSLGKIEVEGPDALEFLDRFYINNLKTLQPGRVRYGLMLRETGILFDDGTVVALAPDHLLITTTSGNAGRVYQWLEEWHQCEWPDLRVAITPVTEQWATVSIAGPKSRKILSGLRTDIDLSNAAFPHLAMREGRLFGFPARIYRVSFTGELTYEINVPADGAPELWSALIAQGEPEGLRPLGLDALMTLRLEKGFLHLGSDTDGTTVPDDVGWGKVAAAKSADFIGKRSLTLPEHVKPHRLQLVGLLMVDPTSGEKNTKPPADGAHLAAGASCGGAVRALGVTAINAPVARVVAGRPSFIIGSHLRLMNSTQATDGWITSAGIETLTGQPIALAMLRGGRQHIGQEITVFDEGTPIAQARVVNPPFYDPTGERMNG